MLTEFLPPFEVHTPYDFPTFWYGLWQDKIPRLVWEYGYPQLATPLRQALLAALESEHTIQRPAGADAVRHQVPMGEERLALTKEEAWEWHGYQGDLRPLINYQHQLVYGLGRLGAFDALSGLPSPIGVYTWWAGTEWLNDVYQGAFANGEAHADRFREYLWRVEAICGWLEPQYNAYFARQMNHPFRRIQFFSEVPDFAEAVEQLLKDRFGLDEEERRIAMYLYEWADYLSATAQTYKRVADGVSTV